MLPRRRLFGLDFVDLSSLDPVVDELLGYQPVPWTEGAPRPCVVTPNVDHMVKLDAGADSITERVVAQASHVLPDGQPIVWASRLLSRPLRNRLTGSDLVSQLWPRLVAEGARSMVVASSKEIADRVEAEPAPTRAVSAPMLSATDARSMDDFVDACYADVLAHRPAHLFVTLGMPKQYHVIDGLLRRLEETGQPVPLMYAVGASFEMHYGIVRRAPLWMQRWGLEWLHRFAMEPRRLFRRYFVDDLAFVRLVWRERTSAAEPS